MFGVLESRGTFLRGVQSFYEAARRIRNIPQCAELQVIAVTAQTIDAVLGKCRESQHAGLCNQAHKYQKIIPRAGKIRALSRG